jgi:hypothetical protein
MSKIDEIDFQITVRHYKAPLQENYTTDMRLKLEDKAKQALYKDLYEIISFSADRGEAYKKLKDYFGETND